MVTLLALTMTAAGCSSYRYYAGDLKPLEEAFQGQGRAVADDGTVTYTQGRLEISLRPLTTVELNRQFSSQSQQGAQSTNPYTFGNSEVFRTGATPQRFTVFRLRVENYQYPKVHLDPSRIFLTTRNGRKYHALSYEQMYVYYRRYSRGGAGGDRAGIPGNEFKRWRSRIDLLKRTLFPDQDIFSAQEREGYVVFKPLAADVARVTVHIPEVVVRFDYKDDPIETADVSAEFERQIGRVYADGRKEVSE
jgi:hypothetical protein